MDGMIAMVGLRSLLPALAGHPREAVNKVPTNTAGTQIDEFELTKRYVAYRKRLAHGHESHRELSVLTHKYGSPSTTPHMKGIRDLAGASRKKQIT
jgi:hypothetical protein